MTARRCHFNPMSFFSLLICLFAAELFAADEPATAAGRRPNVIVLLTDDQGYADVGFHGNTQLKTPHLDEFARQGIEFDRFYCSPVCAPTRASLMTGRYYYRSGVIHTSRGGAKMHGDEVTLAERFQSGGYRTGIFGKWHLGDSPPMRPQDQGFDECLVHKSGGIGQSPDQPNSYENPLLWRNGQAVRPSGYCTDIFFDAALQFIAGHRQSPFFVYLATNAPHTPLEIAESYVEPYRQAGLDETTARVYGMITNIDENFGRLLKRLEQLRLRDDTLIIFMGDNGPQQARYNAGLRGRKSQVYEGGIRVPCVWQWPARWKSPGHIQQIAAHLDVAATLSELCQLPLDDTPRFDGISLRPWLDQGPAASTTDRRLVFQCHRGLTPHPFHNAAVVTQRFKLVCEPGTFGSEQPPATPTRFELYDLQADPGESRDVSIEHRQVVNELKRDYENWFQDVRLTRQFEPGRIRIDDRPIVLCRYQDGQFQSGKSTGWPVDVRRGGTYVLQIRRDTVEKGGHVSVRWRDTVKRYRVDRPSDPLTVELEPGRGLLQVLFQPHDADQPIQSSQNTTDGDVTLTPAGQGG